MFKKVFAFLPLFVLIVFLAAGCGSSGGGTVTTTTTAGPTTTTLPLTAYHFSGTFVKSVCTHETMVVALINAGSIAMDSNPYVTWESLSFSGGSASFDISTTATGEYVLLGFAPGIEDRPDYIAGYGVTSGDVFTALSQLITLEATGAYSRFSLGNMSLYLMTGD